MSQTITEWHGIDCSHFRLTPNVTFPYPSSHPRSANSGPGSCFTIEPSHMSGYSIEGKSFINGAAYQFFKITVCCLSLLKKSFQQHSILILLFWESSISWDKEGYPAQPDRAGQSISGSRYKARGPSQITRFSAHRPSLQPLVIIRPVLKPSVACGILWHSTMANLHC